MKKHPKGQSVKQLKEQLERQNESYQDIRKRIELLENKLDKKVKKFEASILDLREELENLRFKESHRKTKIDTLESVINEQKTKIQQSGVDNPIFAPPVEPVMDDLTNLSGLEDKHERILNMYNLVTYKQLLQKLPSEIQSILEDEGVDIEFTKIKNWLEEASLKMKDYSA